MTDPARIVLIPQDAKVLLFLASANSRAGQVA